MIFVNGLLIRRSQVRALVGEPIQTSFPAIAPPNWVLF